MIETLKAWDKELFIYLNQLGSERFDAFWLLVTRIDSWIFLFIFFGILIFKYFPIKRAVIVSLCTVLTFAITFGVKFLTKLAVERLRPSQLIELSENIRVLQFPVDYSFFSGHASVSLAITTFVVLCLRKSTRWIYIIYIWPLLFSMSRIYVGVHYPSDIIAGWMVGTVIAFFMYYIMKKMLLRIEH
jgi:undecaprenyl-diphosphatase